jgi:hypothetical protein
MKRIKGLVLIAFLILVNQKSFAKERRMIAASGSTRVQLLELYSSESCSSCPPADDWVSGLKSNSDLWRSFVPIVFHVDYWNKLGWKDELSAEPMTARQIELSNHWSHPNVYTPGMVVDGSEWQDWGKSVNHKLPAPGSYKGIKLILFQEADDSFTVKVTGQKASERYIVRFAVLGMGLSTKVTAGENSGKILKHNFVVLSWDSKPSDAKSDLHFALNPAKQKVERLAVAAWIEQAGSPAPLQAVGGYL